MIGIGQGVIVARRASGRPNWFAILQAPQNIAFPSGDDVAQLVASRTFLHSLRDENALLDTRFRLAPNVRLEQVSQAVDGSWRQVSGKLHRVGGLEYSGILDGESAAMLARFDGQRPIREYLQHLAAAVNADPATFVPSTLPIIRRLVEQGFLLPPDD